MPKRTKPVQRPGDHLRDSAVSFLTAVGFDANPEVLVGHKKVDILAREEHLGETKTIGIECKDYDRPLGADFVKKIWTDYASLVENKAIDECWLVTSSDISAASKAYVSSTRNFRHLTWLELQRLLVDFRPYTRGLRQRFREKGLDHYYIPAKTPDGHDLSTIVDEWIIGSDSSPLALLAGYGQGKTSFAEFVANAYAERYEHSSTGRIPIYIPLGEISAEQSLEGLLGKIFTTTFRVKGYSFAAFMHLNHGGRLLLLLDAFDEMKFALTWRQFVHNFNQINRLVVPSSRVLLLGRPNAFLSDDEHDWILRGIRKQGTQVLQVPGAHCYTERQIAPFDNASVETFLLRYLTYLESSTAQIQGRAADFESVGKRVNELKAVAFGDLIKRPVHAKMIAELACNPSVKIRQFSSRDLYSLFVNQTIEREVHEKGRTEYGVETRRQFAASLAWWLWKRSRTASIGIEEVPDALVAPYADKDPDSIDAARRDLVSACFLERKYGDVLYFPHRSFQEFLVSEYLLIVEIDADELEVISGLLNDEIVGFILQGDYEPRLSKWLALLDGRGGIMTDLFLFLLSHEKSIAASVSEDFPRALSSWSLLALLKAFERQDATSNDYMDLLDLYLEVVVDRSPTRTRFMREVALLCTVLAISAPQARAAASLYATAGVCAGTNFHRFMSHDWSRGARILFVQESDGLSSEAFCNHVEFRGDAGKGNLEMRLVAGQFQDRLLKRLRRRLMVERFFDRPVFAEEWVPYLAVSKLVRKFDSKSGRSLDAFVHAGLTPGNLRMARTE